MSTQGANEIGGYVARLEFEEGTRLAGRSVRASLDVPLRDSLGFQRTLSSGDADEVMGAYRKFGDEVLIDWDVEFKGEAVPATGEGMLSIPGDAAGAVLLAWVRASTDVEGNSRAVSQNGATSQAPYVTTAPV